MCSACGKLTVAYLGDRNLYRNLFNSWYYTSVFTLCSLNAWRNKIKELLTTLFNDFYIAGFE